MCSVQWSRDLGAIRGARALFQHPAGPPSKAQWALGHAPGALMAAYTGAFWPAGRALPPIPPLVAILPLLYFVLSLLTDSF